jgi:hypothetical protein
MLSLSRYVLIEEPPEDYRRVLEELRAAGFDLDGVLDGEYDPHELFIRSPTLVKMAVERIRDELALALERPEDYVNPGLQFGYTISIWDFVVDFLDNLRRYYARRPA